jgi:chlorite dismutase
MSTKKDSPLSKVQNLYLMQVELWNFLDNKESDAKAVQKTLKQFNALLKEVDWRLMGGEDVLESMQMIPKEVKSKLKGSPKRKPAAVKKATKKPTAKKAVKKKVPAKKAPAKKKKK